MKLKTFLTLICLTIAGFNAIGQILHTESFAVVLDSTKMLKGSIVPSLKYQNLKKDLLEFENTSDLSIKLKESAITIANKIELSKYGEEVLLSGGFFYLEYRKLFENKFVVEPYSQLHWSEARGLEFKYAGGINLRYRILLLEKLGLYVGTGPFYEFEEWNYDGVPYHLVPANAVNITNEKVKLGSYLSFKWETNFNVDFDLSLYHQSEFNKIFYQPRLASSSSVTINFTEHLGFIFQYQNIYDYSPLVPIDKLYNHFVASFEISF